MVGDILNTVQLTIIEYCFLDIYFRHLLSSVFNSMEYIEQRVTDGTASLPILMHTWGVGAGEGETMCCSLGARCLFESRFHCSYTFGDIY